MMIVLIPTFMSHLRPIWILTFTRSLLASMTPTMGFRSVAIIIAQTLTPIPVPLTLSYTFSMSFAFALTFTIAIRIALAAPIPMITLMPLPPTFMTSTWWFLRQFTGSSLFHLFLLFLRFSLWSSLAFDATEGKTEWKATVRGALAASAYELVVLVYCTVWAVTDTFALKQK